MNDPPDVLYGAAKGERTIAVTARKYCRHRGAFSGCPEKPCTKLAKETRGKL
jgi:hypothetical protein